MLTFEAIYNILRKEKTFQELQKLDQDFYKNAFNYIEEKKKLLSSQKEKDSIFAQAESKKTETQLENIKKVIKELYEKREGKIIQLALLASKSDSKTTIDSLLPEEIQLYESTINLLKNQKQSLFDNSQKPEEPKSIKTNQELKLIRFKEEIQKFVDPDLNVHGPFKESDIANLPIKIADLLIKKEKAEEL